MAKNKEQLVEKTLNDPNFQAQIKKQQEDKKKKEEAEK